MRASILFKPLPCRNSYSFTAPLPLANTLVSSDSVAEFSFDNPSMSIDDVLKANPCFPVSKVFTIHLTQVLYMCRHGLKISKL